MCSDQKQSPILLQVFAHMAQTWSCHCNQNHTCPVFLCLLSLECGKTRTEERLGERCASQAEAEDTEGKRDALCDGARRQKRRKRQNRRKEGLHGFLAGKSLEGNQVRVCSGDNSSLELCIAYGDEKDQRRARDQVTDSEAISVDPTEEEQGLGTGKRPK